MKESRYKSNAGMMTKAETDAWAKIELSFRAAMPVSPRKGFASRWLQVNRQQELEERKRRELWLALGNGTAVLVILGVISFTIWPLFSQPATLFASLLDSFLDGVTVVVIAIGFSLSVFQSLTMLAWLAVAIGFFSLVALWTSLFTRVMVANR